MNWHTKNNQFLPQNCPKSDLSILLNETAVTYYWIGFLMADGHFSEQEIQLAIVEKNHILKYQKYINTKNYHQRINDAGNFSYHVGARDRKLVPIIKSKFDINNNKTYNPPTLDIFEKMNDRQFMSFFIGFIDGDGCITYNNKKEKGYSKLTVDNHSSWFNLHKYFLNRISKITKTNIRSKVCVISKIAPNEKQVKCSHLTITNSKILKFLKNKAIEYDLPVLKRKWDKINLQFFSSKQSAEINKEKIRKLLKQKPEISIKEIAQKMKFNYKRTWQLIKRMKTKGELNENS